MREDYQTFEVAHMETLTENDTSFRPRQPDLMRRYVAMRIGREGAGRVGTIPHAKGFSRSSDQASLAFF